MTANLNSVIRIAQQMALAGAIAAGSIVSAHAQTASDATSSSAQAAASAPAAGAAAMVTHDIKERTHPREPVNENPYGIASVMLQGDVVAKLTLAMLMIMSITSWFLIFAKIDENRRLSRYAAQAFVALNGAKTLKHRFDAMHADSPLRAMFDAVVTAARRHSQIGSQIQMNDWLRQDIVKSIGFMQARLQKGLSVLATIGSISPFVGLFGTVWGIYNALVTIGVSGQASIEKIAGPVGESLIMTALGLAVAVPAVLGYNWIVQRSRNTMQDVKSYGSELHTLMLIEVENGIRNRQATPKSEPTIA